MARFAIATSQALLVGLVLGIAARLVMRLITIIEGDRPEFTIGATAGIVGVFVLASLGGAWGGLLMRHRRIGIALAALATLPVSLLGIAIGGGDLIQSVEDQPIGTFILILLVSLVIALCVVASPVLSWRLVRKRQR